MLRSGEKVCGRYTIVREISSGGLGIIYLGKDDYSNQDVVIKVPRYDAYPMIAEEKLRVEINVLKDLWSHGGHKGIVRYISDCQIGSIPVLVEEYISGESLDKKIDREGPIEQSEAISVCLKILDAVGYFQSLGLVHRALGPDDIMLRNSSLSDPVIIDFGTAKKGYIHMSKGTIILGKPFIAPEVTQGGYCYSSDLYSVAAILLAMIAGTTDIENFFQSTTILGQFLGPILRSDIKSQLKCDSWIFDLLKEELQPDPNKRKYKTAQEMINALKGIPIKIPTGQASLIVLGRRYTLDPTKTYTIGSDSSRDIYIPDPVPYVSRYHAKIFYDSYERSWIIIDDSSTNGTVVIRGGQVNEVFTGKAPQKGARGPKKFKLQDGDIIGLAWSQTKGAYIQLEFEVR